MKVFYLINSLKNGGPVNMLYTLVKYMQSYNIEMTVIALKQSPVNNSRDFSHLNCTVNILNRGGLKENIQECQKIVDCEKPDIIHSHGGVADLVNSRLKGDFVSYSTVHCDPDEDFTMKLGKFKGWLKATAFITSIKKIDNPIACSETVANKIYAKRGINLNYIRNGIDLKRANVGNCNITRKDLDISEDAIVLIFCGYLSKRKNARYICEAIKKTSRKDIYLLVLGDGEEFIPISEEYKDCDRIRMIGRVLNPYAYYIISDVFISASLSEGLPLAVMEGMGCGLKAMLSNIDSHREMKKCCDEGVELFSLKQIDELIQDIETLESTTVHEKGKKARETVLNYLNAKRMAQEYYEMYLK